MGTYICKSCDHWYDADRMAYVCEDCYVDPVDFVRIFKLLDELTDLPPSVRAIIAQLPDFAAGRSAPVGVGAQGPTGAPDQKEPQT